MTPTRSKRLTEQFYNWERRGRGWHVFESLVDLEPPFAKFAFKSQHITHDDGVTRLSFGGALKKLFSSRAKPAIEESAHDLVPLEYEPDRNIHVLSISIPKGHDVEELEAEQFLLMLSSCKHPVSFEILATNISITIQFVCHGPDAFTVQAQLKAYFPECVIASQTTFDSIVSAGKDICIIDLGLKEEFMRPITMADKFAVDPLTGLFGIMENLAPGDQAALQILFIGTTDPWAQSIITSVTDSEGKSFFDDAPEMPKMAQKKISVPLFAATTRAIGQSTRWEQAKGIATNVAKTITHISRSEGNSLILLSNAEYPDEAHINDVLLRQSHRLGMLLNSKELVNFVHLPSASVVSSKLERSARKTKALPHVVQGHPFILGMNTHQGLSKVASLSNEQRLRHVHLIGATGTGKTTLLQNLIMQDINQGKGLAVLDPHGDLIESILSNIPGNRINDVVLVDPADVQYPIGFNILSVKSDIEKDVLSSDLVAVFRRLSTSWGDQMNSVFANAILAFLENSKPRTLMDLRRFLVEKSFRDAYLKTVTDPSIAYYWQREYPLVKSASIGPILTRLDTFLRPKLIRNMVAQNKSLDFESIMNSEKILLVKLSQGLIGDENSYLLGTVFVSKIYQAAMARQAQGKADRKDFFLYVDEFQNFITPSMSQILAGARKYHLGLVLAHQEMQQLVKEDQGLASSVIANPGTRICFRLGDSDAKRFEDGFSFFEAGDLQNLETGQAIVRIDRSEYDFNLSVSPFKETSSEFNKNIREKIIEQSRYKYGTSKEVVEASFAYFQAEPEPVMPEAPKPEVVTIKAIEPLQEKRESLKVEELPVPVIVPDAEKMQKTSDNLVKQRELSQHRYLQTLIKKMAEARGYKTLIEEPTPDGKGRVDVALQKGAKRIACEIGVTTSKAWEVHNIEKCLAAGYEVVVAIPVDAKARTMMQAEVDISIDSKFHAQVLVMEADAFFQYLDMETAKEASTETRIKGYRVKVEYDAVSEEEMNMKRKSVTKSVVDSVKNKKDK